MDDQRLGELLRKADAAWPTPCPQPDLAGRVRSLRRTRRSRNAAAGIVVAMLVVAGTLWAARDLFRPASPLPPIVKKDQPNMEVVQAELFVLREDARMHADTAERMWETEESRRAIRSARIGADPLQVVTGQRNRASLILLQRARRFDRQEETRPQAVEQYREIVELFPLTEGAEAARKRLAGASEKEGRS